MSTKEVSIPPVEGANALREWVQITEEVKLLERVGAAVKLEACLDRIPALVGDTDPSVALRTEVVTHYPEQVLEWRNESRLIRDDVITRSRAGDKYKGQSGARTMIAIHNPYFEIVNIRDKVKEIQKERVYGIVAEQNGSLHFLFQDRHILPKVNNHYINFKQETRDTIRPYEIRGMDTEALHARIDQAMNRLFPQIQPQGPQNQGSVYT